jgi:hypothetical protein
MRGLTSEEEDALRTVIEHETGHQDCGACRSARPSDEPSYSLPDAVFHRLHARGLLHIEPCRVEKGALHCMITSNGKLALRLAQATREIEVDA